MNRREVLASALFAPLAAASAVASAEKEKPSITATRLDPDCHVEVQVHGYPDGDLNQRIADEMFRLGSKGSFSDELQHAIVIDEQPLDPEAKARIEAIWREHRHFTGESPKIVPGWTFTSIPSE